MEYFREDIRSLKARKKVLTEYVNKRRNKLLDFLKENGRIDSFNKEIARIDKHIEIEDCIEKEDTSFCALDFMKDKKQIINFAEASNIGQFDLEINDRHNIELNISDILMNWYNININNSSNIIINSTGPFLNLKISSSNNIFVDNPNGTVEIDDLDLFTIKDFYCNTKYMEIGKYKLQSANGMYMEKRYTAGNMKNFILTKEIPNLNDEKCQSYHRLALDHQLFGYTDTPIVEGSIIGGLVTKPFCSIETKLLVKRLVDKLSDSIIEAKLYNIEEQEFFDTKISKLDNEIDFLTKEKRRYENKVNRLGKESAYEKVIKFNTMNSKQINNK